jgi:hypothetical protein
MSNHESESPKEVQIESNNVSGREDSGKGKGEGNGREP